jgi:hypothetical protein
MVRAILDGRKTQTRRVVKPRHDWHVDEVPGPDGVHRAWPVFEAYVYAVPETVEVLCPFGEPGDRLWVRETFRVAAWRTEGPKTGAMAFDYAATPEINRTPWVYPPSEVFSRLVESSSAEAAHAVKEGRGSAREDGDGFYRWDRGDSPCRWRPSIQAENGHPERGAFLGIGPCHREGFAQLWADINDPDAWNANPWVWVVEFRRVEP